MTEDEMYEVEKNRFQSMFDDEIEELEDGQYNEDAYADGWDADDYDDSMDGDFDSAMRDCGWGTDEDYGYYGEDY